MKPIQTFIKENGDLSIEKDYLVIPIIIKKVIINDREQDVEKGKGASLLFRFGKMGPHQTEGKIIPQHRELRFVDRKGVEDFFAMTIQAVLSSPEEMDDMYGIPSEMGINPFKRPELDKNKPGDTIQKQIILELIQKHILDKDQRQYTM